MSHLRSARGERAIPLDSGNPIPASNSLHPPAGDDVSSSPESEVCAKVRALVSIAASHGSSISSAELLLLLPRGTFAGPASLESFITHNPGLRAELVVFQGEIAFKGGENVAQEHVEQLRLTERRVALAQSLSSRLVSMCPWIRLIAISGSTAYGRTKALDDVDFFIVTRRNRLWITLVVAMLVSKSLRARNRDAPVFCLNRVLDEDECADAFRSTQDPLFAREALSLRILGGGEYYWHLLRSGSWMERPFPELFRQAIGGTEPPDRSTSHRGSRLWGVLNCTAFAGLVPYLVIAGLWRNHRLRRVANPEAQFRTVIRRGFFAYESRKYDLLRETYRRAF